MTGVLQPVLLGAAFVLAVVQHRRMRPPHESTALFAASLGLGAALAHAGWALLHLDRLGEAPIGASVLFVPLGAFALSPTPASFASLPLPLAVARLGCLTAGCCHGSTWLEGLRHPVAGYEIAGWWVLHAVLRRVPPRAAAAVFCLGFGAVRWAVEPFRAEPGLGEPLLPAAWIAGAWMAMGLALAWRR